MRISASLVSVKSRCHFPGAQTKPNDFGAGTEPCCAPRVSVIFGTVPKRAGLEQSTVTNLNFVPLRKVCNWAEQRNPSMRFLHCSTSCTMSKELCDFSFNHLVLLTFVPNAFQGPVCCYYFYFFFLFTGFLFIGGFGFLLASLPHPFPLSVSHRWKHVFTEE